MVHYCRFCWKKKKFSPSSNFAFVGTALWLPELYQLAPTLWRFWATRFFVVFLPTVDEVSEVLAEGHTEDIHSIVLWTWMPQAPGFSKTDLCFFSNCGHTFCLSAVCLHFCHSDTSLWACTGVCIANTRKYFILYLFFIQFFFSSFHPCCGWILPPISVGISFASLILLQFLRTEVKRTLAWSLAPELHSPAHSHLYAAEFTQAHSLPFLRQLSKR